MAAILARVYSLQVMSVILSRAPAVLQFCKSPIENKRFCVCNTSSAESAKSTMCIAFENIATLNC